MEKRILICFIIKWTAWCVMIVSLVWIDNDRVRTTVFAYALMTYLCFEKMYMMAVLGG